MVKGFIEDGSEDYLMEMPIASIKQFTNANGEVEYILGGVKLQKRNLSLCHKTSGLFQRQGISKENPNY